MRLLIPGLAALALLSLFIGRIPFSPLDLLHDQAAWAVLVESRLPRTAAARETGAETGNSASILPAAFPSKARRIAPRWGLMSVASAQF